MKGRMQRRDFLKYAGSLVSLVVVDSLIAQTLWMPSAQGASVSLDGLYNSLDPAQAMILVSKDAKFAETLISFNKRTTLTPTVRVLCRTHEAVSICIQWATQNSVPLAMRSGGHSYEGFSQSSGIVIDTRMMNDLTLSADANTVQIGAGAMLGQIYTALSKKSRALPGGSCPTVGIAGHATGGGYGLLSRPYGLICDSLLEFEMVNAQGQILTVNAQENSDLYWACRGGGGGSFGVITQLHFKTHQVPKVTTFIVSWLASVATAAKLLKAWQDWAPNAPSEITSLFKFTKNSSGTLNVRCVGQTVGDAGPLTSELKKYLFSVKAQDKFTIKTIPWIDGVKQFAGSMDGYPSVYMKGKSDYVKQVHSTQGLNAIVSQLPPGIAVIFDSYGGKIRDLSDQDTAFAHRSRTISSIQYYMEWSKSSSTVANLAKMNGYYNSLRSYMSGSCYVNYCDLDVKDYGQAYWGGNLSRLIDIKTAHDPEDFFNHAQSIPIRG